MTKLQTKWGITGRPVIILQKQRRSKPVKIGHQVFHLYVQDPSGETSPLTRIVFTQAKGVIAFSKALNGYVRHIKEPSIVDISVKLEQIVSNIRDEKKFGIVEVFRNHTCDL